MAARDVSQRVRDTIARLDHERDVWLATAGADGPWLVPLWFVRHGAHLILATGATSRTVRNLSRLTTVRLALPDTDDVVIIDGSARTSPTGDAPGAALDAFTAKYDGDPRRWATAVITVRPDRVLAWHGEHELPGRVIMRDGAWLP